MKLRIEGYRTAILLMGLGSILLAALISYLIYASLYAPDQSASMTADVIVIQAIGTLIIAFVLLYAIVALLTGAKRLMHLEKTNEISGQIWEQRLALAVARKQQSDEAQNSWNGYRKFQVRKRVMEADDICSFYLEPHDRRQLPGFSPGQYLTFSLHIAGQSKPVIRCYSLSDKPCPDYYRVTIKRVPAPPNKPELPPGLSSGYFHDQIQEGDILDVRAPSGSFSLDPLSSTPIVLIGGGVGLTPVLSMLNTVVETNPSREVWFFYGVRRRNEHAMYDDLRAIAEAHGNVHIQVCYSDATQEDVAGRDYQHAERVSVDLFKRVLPSNNYEFYICGPPPMLDSLVNGLREWGVPDENVFFEAFGPSSVKKMANAPDKKTAEAPAVTYDITFTRSGKTIPWDPECDSLLEFAEKHDINLDSGCRAGNCGTCLQAINKGEVEYTCEPDSKPEAGSCLTCVSRPVRNMELDA